MTVDGVETETPNGTRASDELVFMSTADRDEDGAWTGQVR
jgi:hypothetical protein